MKKYETKSLGQRIRLLRGDLTQSEFADILSIKQAMVSRYEADKETPSPRVLLRMAQFSNKTMEWLLTGQDPVGSAVEAQVQRLGAKSTRNMTREDMVEVAAAYLRDTRYPEAEEFIQLMKDAFLDRELLKKILHYYRYLRFEEDERQGE